MMLLLPVRELAVCGILLCTGAGHAVGQQFSSQEAGVGIVAETQSLTDQGGSTSPNYVGPRHLFAGPFGRYTWNLSPSLALEGSVAYLPGFQTSFGVDNGHELLAVGGVKAGWRGRRFGIYGKAEPGIASFSPGVQVNVLRNEPLKYQRRTNFALDYGGVLELYPSERTIIRMDVSQTVLAEFDQVLFRFPGGEVIKNGHIAEHLGLTLSVAHRFGALREEKESVPAQSALDLGVLFALQPRAHLSETQIVPDRGWGAWASYNFSRYVALDGTAFYQPHADGFIFPQDGGTTFEAFAGIKAGIRRDRLGYFAKVRPGLIEFSRTIQVANGPLDQVHGKATDFALDTGGIVEVYPSRHTILRAEAGAVSISYQPASVAYSGGASHFPALQRPTILLLFGAGWRF